MPLSSLMSPDVDRVALAVLRDFRAGDAVAATAIVEIVIDDQSERRAEFGRGGRHVVAHEVRQCLGHRAAQHRGRIEWHSNAVAQCHGVKPHHVGCAAFTGSDQTRERGEVGEFLEAKIAGRRRGGGVAEWQILQFGSGRERCCGGRHCGRRGIAKSLGDTRRPLLGQRNVLSASAKRARDQQNHSDGKTAAASATLGATFTAFLGMATHGAHINGRVE